MWPFKSENRASGGFTDLFVNQLLAQAGGNVYADVSNTAAAELVAGLWGRAFASAAVSPTLPGIGPDTLEAIARAMILDGEYLGAIDVSDGALRLLQSYSWDVMGHADPQTWRYSLELPGPSGNETRQLPAEGVVSCRWATAPSTPWRGVGPFQASSLTGALLANLEKTLAAEAGAPSGYVLPTPKDGADTEGLQATMKTLRGRTGVVETTAAGWGQGNSLAPRQDWAVKRFGGDPPTELRELREDAAEAVVSTCLPPGLAFGNTDGTAAREATRRWFHTSVAPMGKKVANELRTKLEMPGLTLSFPALEAFASDTVGKARSVGQLVAAGLEVEDALVKAGFDLNQED